MMKTLLFLIFYGVPALWLLSLPIMLMAKGGYAIVSGLILLVVEVWLIWWLGQIIARSISVL